MIPIRQRTIKDQVVVEGVGLQTGKPITLKLNSAPANSGVNFIRTDLPNKPLLNIRSLGPTMNQNILPKHSGGSVHSCHEPNEVLVHGKAPERRTTLGTGPLQIQTTEHFLAALSGLGIDNITAELDNVELPGLDGSALGFVEALKKAGMREQDEPRKVLKAENAVWVRGDDNILAVFPSDEFKISYTMSYKNPSLGTHFFEIAVNEKSFEKEIAPARTFCLKEEALILLKMGLGKGANYDNTLVISKEGPVKNKLRFADEPVRHKVLDLIGDLYILGMPLIGHVVAVKSGHKLNMELVKKLKKE